MASSFAHQSILTPVACLSIMLLLTLLCLPPRSIHVLGEGEGSKATLIAWLKRRAVQDFGQSVVGKTVWVCWCADAQYYRGTITHFNSDTGKHQVSCHDSCGCCILSIMVQGWPLP